MEDSSSSEMMSEKKNLQSYNALEPVNPSSEKSSLINQEQLNLQEMLKAQLKETTSLPFSSFAISNCVFGSGILALPYVLRMWGLILGPMFIVLTYLISFYSTHLCLMAKNYTGLTSFSSIGMAAFGRKGSIIVKCLVIVNNFGITLAYLIILCKGVHSLLQDLTDNKMVSSYYFVCAIVFCYYFLFIYLESLKFLAKLSICSVISIWTFTICVIYLAIEKLTSDHPNHLSTSPQSDIGIITCLPTIILAFVYQYNLYNVYRELIQPTDKRFKKASFIGLSICCTVYIITSLSSYIVYGDKTKASVLDNYNDDNDWKDYLLAITFLSNITLVVPMSFFEGRNNILLVIEDIRELRQISSPIMNTISPTPVEYKKKDRKIYQNKKRFYIGTTVIYCILMFIATFIPSIKIVFSLTGAIGANSIAFIIPAAFNLKLDKSPLSQKKGPLVLFVSGIAFAVLCLVAEAISIFS